MNKTFYYLRSVIVMLLFAMGTQLSNAAINYTPGEGTIISNIRNSSNQTTGKVDYSVDIKLKDGYGNLVVSILVNGVEVNYTVTDNYEIAGENNKTYINSTYSFSSHSEKDDVKIITTAERLHVVNVVSIPANGGSVQYDGKAVVSVTVGSPTTKTITAQPASGYYFAGWTAIGGAVLGNPNSATTTISATYEGTVTAHFTTENTNQVTVNINPADAGVVTIGEYAISDGTSFYLGDQTVELKASANKGYSFTGFNATGNVALNTTTSTATTAQTSISATGDGSVTVSFEKSGRWVTVTTDGNGTVDKSLLVFPENVTGTQTVVATPNNGYKFKEWTCTTGVILKSAATTPTAIVDYTTAEGTLTAIFEEDNSYCTVTYDSNFPADAKFTYGVTPIDPYSPYANGSNVTIMNAKLSYDNYRFIGWNTKSDGTGTSYAPNDVISAIASQTTLYAQYEEITAQEIYLVSPELTGGECLSYFKLTETRNFLNALNGAGEVNHNYLNFSIKNDDLVYFNYPGHENGEKIPNGTDIHFWYQDFNGTIFYYPTGEEDYEFRYTIGKPFEPAQTHKTQITPCVGPTKPTVYYYFKKSIPTFGIDDGPATSYVFALDTESSTDNHFVSFFYTRTMNDARAYKLIGNFTSAKEITQDNMFDLTSDKNVRDMKRYVYYGGAAYTSEQGVLTPDSIVYRAHIEKPAEGWGNLCLVMAPSNSVANYPNYNANYKREFWRNAIRPLVQLGYQVDSRAVHGSLITYTEGYNQSINPKMSDLSDVFGIPEQEIQSVEFSMNVTTSTYRMTISRKKELTLYDFEDVLYNDKYYYPNESYLNEKREIVGRGSRYRYFVSWSDMVAYEKPDYIDVFVVSNVSKRTDGIAQITLTKLDLDYIPANVGVVLAAKRSTDSNDKYTYSEHDTKTVYGSYQEFYVAQDMFKARPTGDAGKTYVNKLVIPTNIYSDQYATYNGKSMLTPQFESVMIPQTWYAGTEAYGNNYLFGYYRASDVVSGYTSATQTTKGTTFHAPTEAEGEPEVKDFLFGYWISAGLNPCNQNTSYLHLTREQCDLYNIGSSYEYTTWQNYSSGVKQMPAILFNFAEFDDEATSINNVQEQTPAASIDDDTYYTIYGTKVATPTKGIYIHNGKKVIIK